MMRRMGEVRCKCLACAAGAFRSHNILKAKLWASTPSLRCLPRVRCHRVPMLESVQLTRGVEYDSTMAWLPAALERSSAALALYRCEGSDTEHKLAVEQGDVLQGESRERKKRRTRGEKASRTVLPLSPSLSPSFFLPLSNASLLRVILRAVLKQLSACLCSSPATLP